MDPAAATSDTIKQAQLSTLSHTHLKEYFGIFACAMCISIGKYTVNG